MKKVFLPDFLDKVTLKTMAWITTIEIAIFLLYSQYNGNEIMPKPLGILSSLSKILSTMNFYENFIATLTLIIKGMGISIAVSLFFGYLSLTPAFKNITQFISKLRFLTYTGLIFVFTVAIKTDHDIKI